MKQSKGGNLAFIFFPQSILGELLLYLIAGSQVARDTFRAFTLSDGSLTADPQILVLIGMVIDIGSGLISILLFMGLFRWILLKFNLLKVNENNQTQFKRFFLSMVSMTVLLIVAIPIGVSGGLPLVKNVALPGPGFDALPSQEKARVREIITEVIKGEKITPNTHAEFWVLMKKAGINSKAQIDEIKDIMTGVSSKYMRYVWEDAQQAIRQGYTFKSLHREEYEKYLKKLGVISDFRIKENEEFVRKIATNVPLEIGKEKIQITEAYIVQVLSSLEVTTQKIEQLFTP